MLTAKQEKFVQNLVEGRSQREAYKKAYNAKYKNEAIDAKASALFSKDKVQIRYKELIDETAKDTIMNAIKRKEWLTKVINGEITIVTGCGDDALQSRPDMTDRLKALDILNKMDGEYTTKVEGNLDVTIEVGISDD